MLIAHAILPSRRRSALHGVSLALVLLLATAAFAVDESAISPLAVQGPVAGEFAVTPTAALPAFAADPVDRTKSLNEDEVREYEGLPPRFALGQDVSLSPETHGVWETLNSDYVMWRLRVTSPGALSLNLGFLDFQLPKNSRLTVYPADVKSHDDERGVRTFTEADNEDHGELWSPVILANDIVVELVLPTQSRNDYRLALTSVNRGYRYFGELVEDKSGSCNIDVVCPEGDLWRYEINSVGVYTVNGVWYCTGVVVNNTAQDETPYFLTANHCGVGTSNDQGVVIYWNFQSPVCGQQGGGSLSDFNSGVIYRTSSSTSDYTLVELEEPLNPAHEVSYAGWDNSGDDLSSAIAIHHPSTDEKSISFEYDATTTTSYLSNSVPGNGSHIRVIDWDLGTTEPGSSGSPLFDPNHRVVGQLHGGYAACGNNTSDWYGKFSVSWSGLAGYLDPSGTGATTMDTYAPWASGLAVGGGAFAAAGDAGGPFTPESMTYTLTNNSTYAIDYAVTVDVAWADVAGSGGTLAPGGSATATVALNAAAAGLTQGTYQGLVSLTNLTDGDGSTTRPVNLQVGVPASIYTFDMSSDPGWTGGGQWAYGVPQGLGGADHGNADPTAGYTGANVYGYNLAGDYTNNMPEQHLTTTAINCSALSAVSVKFWRWLNVEQPTYDHAYVRVSNDGSTWTTVWENSGEITDNSWTQVEYDISAVADGQATVYLRWTVGTTDSSWLYSGWNIDDVEIWGLTSYVAAAGDVPGQRLTVANHPNPFNPLTKISFALETAGRATLDVYDMQGRLVRRLVSDDLAAGEHNVVWNGLDDGGRKVGSGVYLARLQAGNAVADHKMVMLK